MDINAVSNAAATAASSQSSAVTKKASDTSEKTSGTAGKNTASDSGVIYEKSSDKNVSKKTNSALIAKMKADTDQRTSQLRSLVEKMMTKQGAALGKADSMWSFLAGGNFTVDAATKSQAQADIAEDGYWGVEQTSDRILDFAKALSANDPDKADELLNAFKKGYGQATKSWGKALPDISKRTYDAVVEKFDNWKNETADQTEA